MTFVTSEWEGFTLILLHVDIEFSQHNLLKKSHFSNAWGFFSTFGVFFVVVVWVGRVVGTGVWNQGFTLTKQAFYCLSHISNPFCSGSLEMGSCELSPQASLELWSSQSQPPNFNRYEPPAPNFSHHCWKSVGGKSLTCFTGLCVCLYTSTLLLRLWQYIWRSGSIMLPALFFFLKTALAIWEGLLLNINFRIAFLVLWWTPLAF
jgi:hypothetical protein